MTFTRPEFIKLLFILSPSPSKFQPTHPPAAGKFLIDLLQARMTFISLLFVFSMAEQT